MADEQSGPGDATLNAIADIAEQLPLSDRKAFLKAAFEKKIMNAPWFAQQYPEEGRRRELARQFGVELPRGPFQMTQTKEALKDFMPKGFSAEDAGSVLTNPHATLWEKALASAAYGMHPAYVAGKALTPPIARGRLEGLSSFFPQGYNVLASAGSDIGGRIGSEFGPTGEAVGGVAGGFAGGLSPLMRSSGLGRVGQAVGRQMSMPTFSAMLPWLRNSVLRRSLEKAAEAAPEAGAAPPGISAMVTRPRVRYGPKGIEIIE